MEWTETHNKTTINELLDFYADLLAAYRDFAVQHLDAELPIKLKALQEFKSVATTIELLLKRWSFAYRGYDGNSYQARADANAAVAEQASLTDSETEDDFHDELKITLREVPEIAENGHPMAGAPLTSTQDSSFPQSKEPVKKTKAEVIAAIFDVLEAGEQRTAAIAAAIGRSERSVRRDLKALIAEGKVSKVKKGVYRLHRSVKWTENDNQLLINTLLGIYTALVDACKGDIKKIFASQEISTPREDATRQDVQYLCRDDRPFDEAVVVGASRLARESGAGESRCGGRKTAHTEKVDLASAPLEAFFQIVGHYASDARELIENIPSSVKPPNDEIGTWSYDATTQELFAPSEQEPLSEAEARRRLMKRKSTSPATLFLFT